MSNQPQQLLTNKGVSEIARAAGCSTSTVSNKLKRGKTREQIIQEAQDYRDQQANQPPKLVTPEDGESFANAERRKEIAWANLRELELATKSGELVPVAEINAWMAGCIVEARNILIRIAPELRDKLAIETDPAEIDRLISVQIDRALFQLKEFKK